MERTLIKQGGGGYTIYLPKKWVDRKGLKDSGKIDIRETDTSLIVSAPSKQRRTTTIAVTEENKRDIKTILTHTYRTGADKITITEADNAVQQEVTHVTQGLLGFEVTQRDKHTITIEAITEPADQKYDAIVRRIFLIIKETHSAITEELTTGKYETDIASLRYQQDKLILYCRRILVKEQEEKNLVTQWELLTFLMHIEHAYHYMHEYAKEHKQKVSKRTQELLQALAHYFDLFHNAYFKQDIKLIHKINRLRKEYQFGACYTALESTKGHETIILSHVRELFRLIQIGTSPILSELVLASRE